MRVVRTEWTPDTCGCVLIYEWDRDLPVEERIHTHVQTLELCARHRELPDPQAHEATRDANDFNWSDESHTVWHAVHEENLRKSQTHTLAQEHLADTHVYENQDGVTTWSPGVKFFWEFDRDRVLHVRIIHPVTGFLDVDRCQSLEAKLAEQFGAGKVKVD